MMPASHLSGWRLPAPPPELSQHSWILLLAAALCLTLALRWMRKALAPIGPLIHAVTAVTLVVLAIGAALIFVVAAALGTS